MAFDIRIINNTPLTGENDPQVVAKTFFEQIGFLSKGTDSKIPYTIFAEYFIKHPKKAWFVEEIATKLDTSKPTIYRHLNKLKGLDILEEMQVFDEQTQQKKKHIDCDMVTLKKHGIL